MHEKKYSNCMMSVVVMSNIKTEKKDLTEQKSFDEIKKVYSVQPSKVDGYIEKNYEKLLRAFIKLVEDLIFEQNIFDKIEKADLIDLASDIKNGKIGSSYDKEILNEIAEAFELEVSNESPLLEIFKKGVDAVKLFNIFPYKLKAAGFDMDEFIKLSFKVDFIFLALVFGLLINDKRLEPTAKALARLFKKYVEEKDDILTLVEIYSDEKTRKEFEEAYKGAVALVGKK
jgi:hypothetical protein